MGFRKLKDDEFDNVKEYIFELGLRKLVSLVKPGDSFEQMAQR